MTTDQLCGVYTIRNTQTNAVYIGSTARTFAHRWAQHRYGLGRGTHPCVHLQRAWKKYGEAAFIFEITEIVETESSVLECEQKHLDSASASRRRNSIYNTVLTAGSTRGHSPTYSPEARARRADVMRRVNSDPLITAQRTATLKKTLQTPQAKEKKSQIMRARFQEEGYRKFALENLRSADSRMSASRAISIKEIAARPDIRARVKQSLHKTYPGFIAPDGTIYRDIVGLKPFCEHHGLSESAMSRVASGKTLQHKGWRRA